MAGSAAFAIAAAGTELRGDALVAVRTAGGGDKAAVVGLLARAFADDPAMSWIFPDPADRVERLPRLFALLFDSDAAGMRLVTAGGEAATLWRGPGQVHVGLVELVRRAIPLLWALGPSLHRAMRVSDAIDAHMPSGAFWYLHIAGCDPVHQGRGLGAAAVQGGLARAAGRLPAYLETATERNVGFYQSLGFAVTDEWQVTGGGPRFWSMLRPPHESGMTSKRIPLPFVLSSGRVARRAYRDRVSKDKGLAMSFDTGPRYGVAYSAPTQDERRGST